MVFGIIDGRYITDCCYIICYKPIDVNIIPYIIDFYNIIYYTLFIISNNVGI